MSFCILYLNHFSQPFSDFHDFDYFKIIDHLLCQMSLIVVLSDVSSSFYLIMHWQEYHRCDAGFLSLHPIRPYTTSICRMTGNIRFITWLRWGNRQHCRIGLWPWPVVLLSWLCSVLLQRGDYPGGPNHISPLKPEFSLAGSRSRGQFCLRNSKVTGIQL